MKVIKKTWILFCFLAMALLITVGIFPGTAFAKELEAADTGMNVIESDWQISELANSPLYKLKKASDDLEVEFAEHETDILVSDSHTLTLKNSTEDMDISFDTSNSSILSVKKKNDSSCVYTGEAYGTADIIVTVRTEPFLWFYGNTTTKHVKISVTPHATSIKSVKQKISLVEGKKATFDLTVRPGNSNETPVFNSKNPKVATVSAQGKITAKTAGSTYITATIANGKTTQCLVTVKKAN